MSAAPIEILTWSPTIAPQNSLFSSIVAAFIIEIYRTLLPDRGQQTVDLLSQLVSQSSTSQSPSSTNFDNASFHPPGIAIRINIVLFLSFFLSVMSAVACAFIQQWCLEYMKYAYPRAAPHECGYIRTYLFRGLHRFGIRRFMYGTHVILHISVFLFFWALSEWFFTLHTAVGAVSRYCLVAALVVYVALSILPLNYRDSPYNTPLTHPIGGCYRRLRYFSLWLSRHWPISRKHLPHPDPKEKHFKREVLIFHEAEKRSADVELYGMQWLLKENDFGDHYMDKFLEGLPGYMSSYHTKEHRLDTYLPAEDILYRIRGHFLTCATSSELSEEENIARVSRCVESLRLIFQRSILSGQDHSHGPDLRGQQMYIEEIASDFHTLCRLKDPRIALRASCVRGLAVQGLLTQFVHPDNATGENRPFPLHLIPIYTLCFRSRNSDIVQRILEGHASSDDNKKIWDDLLSDGPLTNLTMLVDDILLREGVPRSVAPRESAPKDGALNERVPSSSLSFCWKTLKILLNQLHVARTEVSGDTDGRFNSARDDLGKYVRENEQGFRIRQLFDILDTVSRGLRLSMVFSKRAEYHSRADIVFGEEHFQNGDFLKAFARCLPDYVASVSKSPDGLDKLREFMEGVVHKDKLWASLQVNLWNAQRSGSFTPDKLRIFEDCCTVLDVALWSLENSTKVDWRAPEFGSLAQKFESFITHCFQDSFMRRATRFRVGLIRSRCCKILLAQFFDEIQSEGTIFFRSQWDVAFLAKLFWNLGIGDGKDAEFWKGYLNGGHIGSNFTSKAREMIKHVAHDGPLLIFHMLGHLATTSIPLHGSDLSPADLEKVWDLQRSIMNDPRLPFRDASDQVWDKLRGLRAEVSSLCVKKNHDGDMLRPLLEMIDTICPTHSEEASSSEPGGALGPRTSFSSKSTTVARRRPGVSPANEDSYGGASS
jgi:hypothetical protein